MAMAQFELVPAEDRQQSYRHLPPHNALQKVFYHEDNRIEG